MNDPTTDDNPLSVDEAMDLIGKWETHPGLLTAIFDASRRLRDQVELLRDIKNHMQNSQDELVRIIAQHVRDRKAMQTEIDQLRAVVAQHNQSIAAIVSRWIKPSTN
jgi:predicted small metal-binding protein